MCRSLALTLLLAPVVCAAQGAPATQPAHRASGLVLVLPFTNPAPEAYRWVGHGVQQDLLADLTPHVRGTVLAPADAPAAADHAAALEVGRAWNASVVVFGNAQAEGDQLRLTGQVLDVTSGRALAGLKATGTTHNVFALEDALAAQVIRAVPVALLTRQSLGMLRRERTPATFAEPLGGAYAPPRTTVVLSPLQPVNASILVSPPPLMYSGAVGPAYVNPRGPNPPAYPFSFYYPHLSSYYSPDVFVFVDVRHGR